MASNSCGVKLLLWLVTISLVSLCCSGSINDDGWEKYKLQYNKKYSNATIERIRRTNRQQKLAIIEKHNRYTSHNGIRSAFFLRENALCDMTDAEYSKMLGYRSRKLHSTHRNPKGRSARHHRALPQSQTYYNTVDVSTLPSCVNWTDKGWVGPVLYQGKCGSCWSYSAVGSLQAQYYNATGNFVQLSTQNLIDCSYPQGNYGCDGGNMQNAYQYVAANGIQSSSNYPDTSHLTGNSNTCQYNSNLLVTSIDSYYNVDDANELALQQAVALVGPVSVAVDASLATFQSYGGGVYNDPNCGSSVDQLNHAVLVVGYGVYNQQPYWLVQNSWGTSWGINGFMLLARNAKNACGIANDASFPIIGWKSRPPSPPVSGSVNCDTLQSSPSSSTLTLRNSVPAVSVFCLLPLVVNIYILKVLHRR